MARQGRRGWGDLAFLWAVIAAVPAPHIRKRARAFGITTAVVRQGPLNGRYRAQCAMTGVGRTETIQFVRAESLRRVMSTPTRSGTPQTADDVPRPIGRYRSASSALHTVVSCSISPC